MCGLGESGVHRGDEVRLRLGLGLNSRERLGEGGRGGGFTLWGVGQARRLEDFGGHERG